MVESTSRSVGKTPGPDPGPDGAAGRAVRAATNAHTIVMRQKRWSAGALSTAMAVAFLLTSCGGVSTGPDDGPLEVADADRNLVGRWTDRAGRELPDGSSESGGILVISSSVGSTTCTTSNVTVFIQLAWPVGTELDWDKGYDERRDAPRFVRDTAGSGLSTEGPPGALDTTLPATATATGFTRQGNTISVDERQRLLYVQRPDGRTERWARLAPETGCA